jgi:hypothetical protein
MNDIREYLARLHSVVFPAPKQKTWSELKTPWGSATTLVEKKPEDTITETEKETSE